MRKDARRHNSCMRVFNKAMVMVLSLSLVNGLVPVALAENTAVSEDVVVEIAGGASTTPGATGTTASGTGEPAGAEGTALEVDEIEGGASDPAEDVIVVEEGTAEPADLEPDEESGQSADHSDVDRPEAAFAEDATGPADGELYNEASREPVDEMPTGAVPIEIDALSVHDANEEPTLSLQEALPSKYDSREVNHVTEVKDQNIFGTCWSFATIAALESSLLAHGQVEDPASLDLSERHLAYFTFHQQEDDLKHLAGDATHGKGTEYASSDLIPDAGDGAGLDADPYLVSGGNFFLTAHALASGLGAANEGKAPYDELLLSADKDHEYTKNTSQYGDGRKLTDGTKFLEATALPSDLARGDNAAWLTGFRYISMGDVDEVKRAVMDNGGVAVSVNSSATYFNRTYKAWYDYDKGSNFTHQVEIVGWDDDYSRLNFGKSNLSSVGNIDLPAEALDAQTNPATLTVDEGGSSDATAVWKYIKFSVGEEGRYKVSLAGLGGSVEYGYAYLYESDINGKMAYRTGSRILGGQTEIDTLLLGGRDCYLYACVVPGSTVTLSYEWLGPLESEDLPNSNGAWLAKNSWGKYWIDFTDCDGYVWISYEDAILSNPDYGAGVFMASSIQTYDNTYQYDGGTSGPDDRGTDEASSSLSLPSGGSLANVFTAEANPGGGEFLKAVSVWLDDVNVDCSVQVYLNPDEADPASGEPCLYEPTTYKTSAMGYYNIELGKQIPLYRGDDLCCGAHPLAQRRQPGALCGRRK